MRASKELLKVQRLHLFGKHAMHNTPSSKSWKPHQSNAVCRKIWRTRQLRTMHLPFNAHVRLLFRENKNIYTRAKKSFVDTCVTYVCLWTDATVRQDEKGWRPEAWAELNAHMVLLWKLIPANNPPPRAARHSNEIPMLFSRDTESAIFLRVPQPLYAITVSESLQIHV